MHIKKRRTRRPLTLRMFPAAFLNFLIYSNIGLPMAVIPIFVTHTLHFNTMIAGLAVSLQYIATFISRASAGMRADRMGPKPVAMSGLLLSLIASVILLSSGLHSFPSTLALPALLLSRIILGWAESWTTTAAIIWNIRRVGSIHTAQVISWNGITAYGGIAFGAAIGVHLSNLPHPFGGLIALSGLSALFSLSGIFLAKFVPAVSPLRQETAPLPFSRVFRLVLPYGCVLSCGSVGFGAIATCLALYFSAHNWPGAALALANFGVVMIAVRLLFTRQISRLGGLKIAVISLVIETLGFLIIAFIPLPIAALLGAGIVGGGSSLIFPALGVVAVERAGAQNRGAAVGAFSVFADLAIGLSGPLLGLIIQLGGYALLFLFAASLTFGGALAVPYLRTSATRN